MPWSNTRWRRLLWRCFRVIILIYVLLNVGLYFFQGYILFPAHALQGKPIARLTDLEPGCELLHLTTSRNDHIAVLFGPALQLSGQPDSDPAHRPTLLYFYGNGGSIAWAVDEVDLMRRWLHVNVLMPDYPGYGMSDGRPSEAGFYAAADAVYNLAHHRADIDPHQLFALGWSMGGAVAIDLASRRPVDGLITVDTFTSIPAMCHVEFPWLGPPLFLSDRFDSISKMPRVHCPVLIAQGKLDKLIPGWMADRLAAAATTPVTRVWMESATHNTVFTAEPERLFPAVGAFLVAAVPPASTRPVEPR